MSIATLSNFKIFSDQFYSGFNEVVSQNGNAFGAASADAIRLIEAYSRGSFREEAFFDTIGSLITRRDPATSGTASNRLLSADSMISPKLSRMIGPVKSTVDALRKAGFDLNTDEGLAYYSFIIGQQVGQASLVNMLNSGLYATVAATGKISSTSLSIVAASGTKTLNYQTGLIPALAKFGDRAQDIVAFVMHSKAFFDLMGSNIAVATDRVAGATIYEGTTGTLGKPVVVTDSAALVKTDGGGTGINSYYTLGLRRGALDIQMSEDQNVYGDIEAGNSAGLLAVVQGEYAFNPKVLGYSWNSTANPTDANLGTGSNWTQVFTDYKWTAGVRLETL